MPISKSILVKITSVYLLNLIFVLNLIAQENPTTLSSEEVGEFIKKSSELLVERYVFEDVAKKVAAYIQQRYETGVYDTITTNEKFAAFMTKEVQSISHDKHMRVRLRRPGTIPGPDSETNPLMDNYLQKLRREQENYGFKQVEIMENNIGYVDFRYFAPRFEAEDRVAAVMGFLKYSDAIIFDVRKNGGGNPAMVQLICSYLFDKKIHLNSLYWRETDRTEEYWTLEKVEGQKIPDIPVFVLTSNRTFSGAEEFSYNLKTRERAIIVGEVTGGGANPGGSRPITRNFLMFIPNGRAINPVTGTNWEGVGVQPDIEVSAEDALSVALEKANVDAKEYRELKIQKAQDNITAINNTESKVEKLVNDGKFEEARLLFYNALESGINNQVLNEGNINSMGYSYLEQDKDQMALIVFKFNVDAFPEAFNTYDSLGEAFMKTGENKLAIKNYKKSLDLNPDNTNAVTMLEKLRNL